MPNTRVCAEETNSLRSTSTKEKCMETLQYKIIKTETQYFQYCNKLEALTDSGNKSKTVEDEIELITLLIEKYDEEHNSFDEMDPVALLKSLMKDHRIKSIQLAELLGVSRGLVSDILNYKKGMSKETIRILSARFKLNQLAFNRPYKKLSTTAKRRLKRTHARKAGIK